MSVPRFFTFLINDPFSDPGLMIECSYEKVAFLFDLGDLSNLSERKLLRITHVFVTHAHVDHFFGFDRIIRLFLGRNKLLHLYGPPGFSRHTEGKLSGYKWNLVDNYKYNFRICVTEIHGDHVITQKYESHKKFKPSKKKKFWIKEGIISSGRTFDIVTTTLDHGIPCLGFSFREKKRIKILPHKLEEIGVVPGKWIKDLKQYLPVGKTDNNDLEIPNTKGGFSNFNIAFLINEITEILPGERITYITDVNFSEDNQEKMIKLAHKSTHLFIEATFITKHKALATKKNHLTAKQAARIARMSGSEKYTLFHHSSRYIKCPNCLSEEARKEFRNQVYSSQDI